jgi:anti-sigma factor RsiW
MTTIHDEFLELAAAAIDFDLSRDERNALDGHLAACVPCRRRVSALHSDQRAIAQLPPYLLAPAAAQQVRTRVQRSSGPARPSALRLLAIAAVLSLLALAALAVGAEWLRRDRERDLTVVPPSVPTETPSASIGPNPSPGPGIFVAGSTVEIVVTGLRVRTAPTVDDSKSAKLDPLLGRGVQLQVIEGPVTADDYDWYLVQAIGWPHRGWVAAADHDGAAWIEDRSSASSPAPAYTAVEAALVAGLRADAAVNCAPRREGLPGRAIAGVECRVNAAVVTRVGAYQFGDARDAATTYLERMASYGVGPGSGDCAAGTSGDAAWMPGDGKAGKAPDRVFLGATGPWVVGRSGCYLDENGTANVRVTCGSTYVGVLGRDEDLASLLRWTWSPADGAVASGDPPGICRQGS